MKLPSNKDIVHKTQLLRLLKSILNTPKLASILAFKGGTYAALRGLLNRFSVDLDFDLIDIKQKENAKQIIEDLIDGLKLEIKDHSQLHLQYFLKYDAQEGERNTLKLEIHDSPSPLNIYETVNLNELNLVCIGHTKDTMFSNKMFGAIARFEKNGKVAGRDFYDMHQFFYQNIGVNKDIIEERANMKYLDFLKKLIDFTTKELNETVLLQDLNILLPKDDLKLIVPHIKDELLMYLNDELKKS